MRLFKKRPPQHLIMVACMTFVLTSACSDNDSNADPAPSDTDLPTVTITGLQENAVIWNTVTVTIAAEDNDAVQGVEVQIDHVTVETKTEESFTYALNTIALKLADGPHTLTVIVTDAAGNQKKQEYTFTVRNTLISATVPNDLLEKDQTGYIFLSDTSGKMIVGQAYENGDEIRLTAPTYTGSEFYLTEAILGESGDNLVTFSKVNRGTWVLTPSEDTSSEEPAPTGTAQLSFYNALPNVEYNLYTDGGYTQVSEETASGVSLELYKNPTPVYITRAEMSAHPTHYLLTVPVASGAGNDPIDLGLVNNAMTRKTVDVSSYGYRYGGANIDGLVTAGDYLSRYPIDNLEIEDGEIEYRYPGNAFAAYYSQAIFWGSDFIVNNAGDNLPDVEPLAATTNVKVNNGIIKGTFTSENADLAMILFVYRNEDVSWIVYTPKGSVDIITPELPEGLQSLGTRTRNYSEVVAIAVQKPAFDGYDGYLDFIRNSTNGSNQLTSFGETYKLRYIFLDGTVIEGRKASSTKKTGDAHPGRR